MDAGFGGTGRDAQGFPDLGKRIAKVVMEHERGAQLDRQSGQASLELVSQGVQLTRVIDLDQGPDPTLDLGAPALATCLAIALPDEQPMQPGFEAIRVPERAEVTPGDEQRLLGGILGPIGVPEDEPSDGVEPTNHETSQL